jgi:hypothetical protein
MKGLTVGENVAPLTVGPDNDEFHYYAIYSPQGRHCYRSVGVTENQAWCNYLSHSHIKRAEEFYNQMEVAELEGYRAKKVKVYKVEE